MSKEENMSKEEKPESENLKDTIRRLSEDIEDLKKRVKTIEDQVMRNKAMRRWV